MLWLWGGAGLIYIVVRVVFFSGFSGNSLRVEDLLSRFLIYLLADLLLPGAASPFPPLLLLIIAIVLTLVIYKMKKRFLPGIILFLFSLLIFLEYCRG